jgi:hypothetical protein
VTLLDRLLPWRRAVERMKAIEAERARQMQLSGVMVMRREARDRQRERDRGHLIIRGPEPWRCP